MSFYPNVKTHISPSALDNWFNGRGTFVRSYFMGVKSPESAAMKSGTKIHGLIEAGLLSVHHRFEHPETVLCYALLNDEWVKVEVRPDGTYDLPEGARFAVYGVPDSFGKQQGNVAAFVDYKSGKENTWDDLRLAGDLKMKLTAFLVWLETGRPASVKGYIEYIPTQWNDVLREIEPTGGESVVVAEADYGADEMAAFAQVIIKTTEEVNEEYEEWLTSTDEFVDKDDVALYGELDQQAKEIALKMEVIKERIAGQMEFGKKEAVNTPFGTFYFIAKKKWEYPDTLTVALPDGRSLSLREAEGVATEIAAAAVGVKKKFETENAPAMITKSLGFRASKQK